MSECITGLAYLYLLAGTLDADLFKAFFNAAGNGDLKVVKNSIMAKPEIMREQHQFSGETALHVAAKMGHVHVVEELVSKMEDADLEIEEKTGMTALALATMHGITRIAECMVQKNKKILNMKTNDIYRFIPVESALSFGNKHMGRYLYSVTPLEELLPENGTHGATVVTCSLNLQCFGKYYK